MNRPCACGACDSDSDPGSRYHGDHHKRLVVARRKLTRLRRYAEARAIIFDIELVDLLDLVHRRWPDTSWQLRRARRDEGFVPDNIVVFDRRAAAPGGARLLVERAGAALRLRRPDDPIEVPTVLEAFRRQQGRCAVSGQRLSIIGRPTDGDALDVRPPLGEDEPVTLVVRAVADHEARWGRRHLMDLAAAIAARSSPRAAEHPR